MAETEFPYSLHPGSAAPLPFPRWFTRFFPDRSIGAYAAVLRGQPLADGWVLDPFGASPFPALEAAQAGYRALVAVNNPIARFWLELLASASTQADLQSVLAELATARKGSDRLEKHLAWLYETICPECGSTIPAQAFCWERGEPLPFARRLRCPHCGASGEFPITPSDEQRLASLPPAALHRARAIERVAALDDPDRETVERLLDAYLPRALYVLFTLINQREIQLMPPARRLRLTALLLGACAAGSSFWAYPSEQHALRQWALPERFLEWNLWQALEDMAAAWPAQPDARPVPVAAWPEQAPAGGITLFPGRARDLPAGLHFNAVMTALPMGAPVFWNLSALWTGWIWGRQATAPLRSAIKRRRFDLDEQCQAQRAAWEAALPGLAEPGLAFATLPTLDPVPAGAALVAMAEAARASGRRAQVSLAARDALQIHWQIQPNGEANGEPIPLRLASLLLDKAGAAGQPLAPEIYSLDALRRLAAGRQLPDVDGIRPLVDEATRLLQDRARFRRSPSPTGALWEARPAALPPGAQALWDRVEMALVRELQRAPGQTTAALDELARLSFPGLDTPPPELVHAVLGSYAVLDGAGGWTLRAEERPATRRAQVEAVVALLAELGRGWGYGVSGTDPLVWRHTTGAPAAVLFVLASTVLRSRLNRLEEGLRGAPGAFFLAPERMPLAAVKLRLDPGIERAGFAVRSWQDLRPTLTQEAWRALLGWDPPAGPEQYALDLPDAQS